jgi:NADPH:quinone reductase
VFAAWYERQGEAAEVFQIGDLPPVEPGPGEVRVRLSHSGVNPGDTKKRRGWLGSTMPFPRVIPHSDGAGLIVSVGEGVDPARVGRRVWVFGAQPYRPFGTAAQLTIVPSQQAVDLPDGVSDEAGACLGIPGISAHRTVFVDGSGCRPDRPGPRGARRRRRAGHTARAPGRRNRHWHRPPQQRPTANHVTGRRARRRPRPA